MAKQYISLQGELILAKIINGVAGNLFSVGNVPEATISITSDQVPHYEATTGQRAKDAQLFKQTGVSLKATLEEVKKENLSIVLSGKTIEVAEKTIADESIGSVTAGATVDLGLRNLSEVVFKSAPDTTITEDKYVLDAAFGTVTFIEAIVGDVKWSGKSGAVTRTAIANDIGKNTYRLLFKGIDTFTGDKIALTLWNLEFSPETEFSLIHEDFGSFELEGDALADTSKANDTELSIFGHVDRFKVAA
ncbi:hypothetical protein EXE10_01575 [Acinetobacter sp. WCHAc060033]|uniref:phage tail tube protein n=1 Tax=Acinetobacter sp. WCHAc060033 TaxID=2518624 RepID=UPI001023A9E7|nr:hypothetical protein [Acinetobacter sp. WCHAc060033]RZG88519.1 hypothetical protein EXE10_01575 [Acinetobacter sp. WCHAc060033]